ncbi:hypothetical protein PR048_027899 [Dryococelus australis]|uniref:Uncharacterized protein n=1 Tax=Dryococelus australis TaxID=614101 RepID=A0ABQ9GHQ9_9NEOP|nr:hypothetical protein PR048_027899 [Dryococelus australis]
MQATTTGWAGGPRGRSCNRPTCGMMIRRGGGGTGVGPCWAAPAEGLRGRPGELAARQRAPAVPRQYFLPGQARDSQPSVATTSRPSVGGHVIFDQSQGNLIFLSVIPSNISQTLTFDGRTDGAIAGQVKLEPNGQWLRDIIKERKKHVTETKKRNHPGKCNAACRRSKLQPSEYEGRGDVVVRLLASHQCEQGSIPGRVTPGFSHVGIVPDDVSGRRVFTGISRFSPLLHFSAAPFSPRFTFIGSQVPPKYPHSIS